MGATTAPGLASSGSRFLARLVDYVIIVAVTLILGIPMIVSFFNDLQGSLAAGGSSDGDLNLSRIFIPLYFVYDWVLHSFWNGQTVGKRAAGIRVVSQQTGAPPNAGHQAIRSAIFALPPIVPLFLGSIFWLINVLWQLWDKPFKQCLHDKPAQTVVVPTQ